MILIVEDDPFLRMLAVDEIEAAGFKTLEASDADQAVVLLRAAARKGSSEASQELAQIIRRGCH